MDRKKEAEKIKREYLEEGFKERFKEKSPNEIDLHDVHNAYRTLLYIEDTKRIDVVLAVALSSKLEGVPLWLIIVGASGDMKSVQLNALKDFMGIFYLQRLTSKTLVNGFLDKKKHPDLAPKLKDKIVVIRDMASLLKLPPVEKGEVWAQLRDLYDGFAGATSGTGLDVKYSDLKVTLLAGSTPAIDGQILVHQDLGTRELVYRTKGNENKKKVMERCMETEETEENITEQLSKFTCDFLNNKEVVRDFIRPEILEKIKDIALYVSYMRATAELDQYSNEIRNKVYPEEPTRIVKQLKRLFVCLMSLCDDYPEERAIEIIWEVAKSSAFPIRVDLLDFLLEQPDELTTSMISRGLKIGKSTTMRELSILWNMGIVERRDIETQIPERFVYKWRIDKENKFVKTLLSRP